MITFEKLAQLILMMLVGPGVVAVVLVGIAMAARRWRARKLVRRVWAERHGRTS
jgi:hypothetical protein